MASSIVIIVKLLSIILCFTLILSLSVTAFAADNSNATEDAMKESLLERGYPHLYLEHASYSVIKSIYEKPYLEFDSATIVTYNEDTGEFHDYEISNEGIMPYGQIPTADLSLTWAVNKNTTSGSEYLVPYSYDWKNLPFFRWQDPIAISWDSSKFEMKDDSFYKVDMYDGFISVNGYLQSFTGEIKSEEDGYTS